MKYHEINHPSSGDPPPLRHLAEATRPRAATARRTAVRRTPAGPADPAGRPWGLRADLRGAPGNWNDLGTHWELFHIWVDIWVDIWFIYELNLIDI